mmetsp:Transcript_2805/g.4112  ORF Transcript_2805/g.4112 Transcript_2805/m.4112 type:complete len:317 (-) Transcript_2805:220-1170(-)
MAFDQPLEADRVEDLNLFSFLVRAPIVGTLMWILGGDEAKKREEEDKLKEELFEAESDGSSSLKSSSENLRRSALHQSAQLKRFDEIKKGKKLPPRLLGSDISDFGDCAIAEEEEADRSLQQQANNRDRQNSIPNLKKSRKMSWSDETGHALAEYVNESMKREPSSASSLVSSVASSHAKPIKSAMKRSLSVRGATTNNPSASSGLVPKGFGGAPQGGLVVPTRPFGDENNCAYASPEWGWYANLTPPTPEMYASNRYLKNHEKGISRNDPAPTSTNAILAHHQQQRTAPHPSPLSNPAFHKGGRSNCAHWPSVPL